MLYTISRIRVFHDFGGTEIDDRVLYSDVDIEIVLVKHGREKILINSHTHTHLRLHTSISYSPGNVNDILQEWFVYYIIIIVL